MRRFHGDLLMGGVAIRQLDGVFEEAGDRHRCGRFEVATEQESLFELGRPYLLMLDDGNEVPVVVREIDECRDHDVLTVQFESLS